MYFKTSSPLFAEETAYLNLLFDMIWCFLQNHILIPSCHGSNWACCEQLARAPVQLRAVSSTCTEPEGFSHTKTPQFSEIKAVWCHIWKLENTRGGAGSCNVTKWICQVILRQGNAQQILTELAATGGAIGRSQGERDVLHHLTAPKHFLHLCPLLPEIPNTLPVAQTLNAEGWAPSLSQSCTNEKTEGNVDFFFSPPWKELE